MKRILAITMTLAMLLGLMTIGASAAGYVPGSANVDYAATGSDEAHENHQNTANGGGMIAGTGDAPANYFEGETIATGTVNVTATINDAEGSVTHVYAVSINTTTLAFSYGSSATSYIWNPEKLQYDIVTSSTGDTGWSTDQTISVTNYSDLPVSVKAEYTAETGHEDITATITNETLSLTAATGSISGTTGTGEKVNGSFTVKLNGTPSSMAANTKIGTVTLTFSKPTA